MGSSCACRHYIRFQKEKEDDPPPPESSLLSLQRILSLFFISALVGILVSSWWSKDTESEEHLLHLPDRTSVVLAKTLTLQPSVPDSTHQLLPALRTPNKKCVIGGAGINLLLDPSFAEPLRPDIVGTSSVFGWWPDGASKASVDSGALAITCNERATAVYQYVPLKLSEQVEIRGFVVSAITTVLGPQGNSIRDGFDGMALRTQFTDGTHALNTVKARDRGSSGALKWESLEIRTKFEADKIPVSVMLVMACVGVGQQPHSTHRVQYDDLILEPLVKRCGTIHETETINRDDIVSSCPHVNDNIHNSIVLNIDILRFGAQHKAPIESGPFVLVTHGTPDRLHTIMRAAATFHGWTSLALFCVNNAKPTLYCEQALQRSIDDVGTSMPLLTVSLSSANGTTEYPINQLRNIALLCAVDPLQCGGIDPRAAEWVVLLDADLVPSNGAVDAINRALHSDVVRSLCQRHLSQCPTALVLPAYEQQQQRGGINREGLNRRNHGGGTLPLPESKAELLRSVSRGKIAPYKLNHGPRSHRATNFERWKGAKEPYIVQYEAGFEPYVALHVRTIKHLLGQTWPKVFDEQFVGYGRNKVAFAMELNDAGFEFVVVPDAWVLHVTHPKSKVSQKFAKDILVRLENRAAMFGHLARVLAPACA